MNGLGSPGYSVDKLINKYGELITKIKKASSTSNIYILNITPSIQETATFG